MNAFTAVVLALAVATASAGHQAAHTPSGSVSVGHDGAVIAGPSGSVHTDNGLHGHGAGVRVSGPAGDIATHGGHARLAGPGHEHGHGHAVHVAHVTPVAHHGSWGHAAVIAAPAHSWGLAAVVAAPVHAWGHGAVVAPVAHWGHHGLISHGLVAHGHHGW